jgi:hypothetical protein
VENRAVGLTTTGLRAGMLPADRGSRQHLKVMQLLAAVEGDGVTPLAEGLVQGLPRLRRGMTAVVITPSVDRAWVRPLASLRPRGVASVVVTLDAPSYAAAALAGTHGTAAEDATRAWAAGDALPSQPAAASAVPDAQQVRALRHALAEYDLRTYTLRAGSRLAEVLSR